jgi:hypothetical protein
LSSQSDKEARGARSQEAEDGFSFNFHAVPWPDVLKQFAEAAGLTLDLTAVPPGTFTYFDARPYTPDEALNVLNGHLLLRGYALVRRGNSLVSVKIAEAEPVPKTRDAERTQATYEGRTFDEWARTMRTERKPESIAQAMLALVGLAEGERVREAALMKELSGRLEGQPSNRPEPPPLIDLPHPPALHVQRRQPAAEAAARVDADQVLKVEDLFLGRVADDGDLPRRVRSGNGLAEREPAERVIVLPIEGEIGPVVRVHEEVRVRLEVGDAALQEPEVLSRHKVERPARPVGVQGRDPAAVHPEPEIGPAFAGSEHHLVVVAEDRNEPAAALQLDEQVEHALRVGAAVHVVPEQDERIVRLRGDGFEQRSQCCRAAVNVADRDGA